MILNFICIFLYNFEGIPVPNSSDKDYGGDVKLFIKFEFDDRKTIKLLVEPGDSITTVKGYIKNKQGISKNNQRLVFAGCDLENGRSLSGYGIHDGDTIFWYNVNYGSCLLFIG